VGGVALVVATTRGRRRPTGRIRIAGSALDELADRGLLVAGGYLISGTAEAPRALSLRCTHLGCTVGLDREADQLVCPCHGSRFALDGAPISGPARKPLHDACMKRDGDGWVIDDCS